MINTADTPTPYPRSSSRTMRLSDGAVRTAPEPVESVAILALVYADIATCARLACLQSGTAVPEKRA